MSNLYKNDIRPSHRDMKDFATSEILSVQNIANLIAVRVFYPKWIEFTQVLSGSNTASETLKKVTSLELVTKELYVCICHTRMSEDIDVKALDSQHAAYVRIFLSGINMIIQVKRSVKYTRGGCIKWRQYSQIHRSRILC